MWSKTSFIVVLIALFILLQSLSPNYTSNYNIINMSVLDKEIYKS